MSNLKDRKRRSVRRPGNWKAKRTVLILCGGEKTEKFYFENIRKKTEVENTQIDIKQFGAKSPLGIVNRAIRCLKMWPYDTCWCVFDKDDFSDYEQAISKAKRNRIYCAFSKPCFEVWFLLHFEKCWLKLTTCEDVITRLKSHLPDYKKNNLAMFDKLRKNLDIAKDNAGNLLKVNMEDHLLDYPITNVFELLDHWSQSFK